MMIILMKIMKQKGIHEDCIHQIQRVFKDRLYNNRPLSEVPVDEKGRIRVDEHEMRQDVQDGREVRLGSFLGHRGHAFDLQLQTHRRDAESAEVNSSSPFLCRPYQLVTGAPAAAVAGPPAFLRVACAKWRRKWRRSWDPTRLW